MTYNTIVNAAPQAILLGTNDVSTRAVPRGRESIPSHLPKCYFYARRGPTTPQLIGNTAASAVYHTDTFDFRKKYANHATVFANAFLGQGNAIMAQRVLPTDAGPKANALVSLEVLSTMVTDYKRNPDGSIMLDVGGNPVPVDGPPTTVAGYQVRWVVTHAATDIEAQEFGSATISAGTWSDPLAPTVFSQIYPLFHFRESSVGEDGNLTGIRLWAPTANSTGEKFDSRLLSATKAYPARFQVLRKGDNSGSIVAASTLSGTQSVLATFKPGVIDPYSDAQLSVQDVLLQNYNRSNNALLPDVIGNLGEVALYQNNIQTLLTMFTAAEKAYIDANPGTETDFDPDYVGDQSHLFNFLGGTTYSGYPYHTYQIDTGTGSQGLRLTPFTSILFAGGSDGTMSDALFATLVEDQVAGYADPSSELTDDAFNVESVLYDSGFPLDTKYKLLDFLALRKDTAVALSTYEVGGPNKTPTTNNATAVALRARADLYPESDYFGTGVMRVMIMGSSGALINSPYKGRVPALYEIAKKCAAYMGAGNGVWKNGQSFTGAPGSIVNSLTDIDVTFTPADQRTLDWAAGMNWIQRYDRSSFFIPAVKTVYENDTSVLNSWITVLAICEINKVCQRVHRQFSGVDNLSNTQLADRVDREVSKQLAGRFDGRFYIEVETTFTDADIARNYSWTTAVRIGASGTKTVMTSYVEAYRREDLQPQA